MDKERQCLACGANLAGPLAPRIALSQEAAGEQSVEIEARAWICPGCGLVYWYGEDDNMDELRDIAGEADELEPTPGSSYERRTQMLRMLRRVRRM
jgi:uncharacterized protein with PIN domain